MRNEGRLILGFYPLPEGEAKRLKGYMEFPAREFAAVDPCVGDGAAFAALLDGATCYRYGIELDGLRAESATARQIEVLHADTLEVHCPPESLSLLYLNPPYDFEVGSFRNRRFEELFLRHTLRWLKATGVLAFVIPQRRLIHCSALLAEHFTSIRVYRLTSAECVQYHQIAVLASRRAARQSPNDRQYRTAVDHLNTLANEDADIPNLGAEITQFVLFSTLSTKNAGDTGDVYEKHRRWGCARYALRRLSHDAPLCLVRFRGPHLRTLSRRPTLSELLDSLGAPEANYKAHRASQCKL